MAGKIKSVGMGGIPDPMNPRIQPLDLPPIINPDVAVAMTEAQRSLIGLTRIVSPASVRQDQMAQMQAALDAVNTYIRTTQADFSIRFELHQRSGLTYALIRNMETGQVLKQIPSETLLNIAARVKMASGIFVDLAT
jgi:uncharacterized FlaG/YvyC family protein